MRGLGMGPERADSGSRGVERPNILTRGEKSPPHTKGHSALRLAPQRRRMGWLSAWSRSTERLSTDSDPNRRARAILWGTCDTSKPRVRILRDGLRANGIEVIECRAEIWEGIKDKSEVRGFRRWAGLLLRMLAAYPRLVSRYMRLPKHDYVLLGYPAILDIFIIRPFAWLRGANVAMDWFLSAYDTVVLDRGLVQKWHPLAGALRVTEWVAIRLADYIFMDTQSHARRMEQLFGLPVGRCGSVWVGVEDEVFQADQSRPIDRNARIPLQILFYGQFIPLHGVPTIIEAARLLEAAPVEWLLIGDGQEAEKIRSMLEDWPLPKVRWVQWVDYESLREHILAADLCLGIFGTSDKAASVIPNKVFQALAVGKPLITRESMAVNELLNSETPGVQFVPPADGRALAEAVTMHLEERGNSELHFSRRECISTSSIGRQLAKLICAPLRP